MRSRHTEGARLEEERPTDGEEMAEDNDQGAAPDEDEDEKDDDEDEEQDER